MFVKFSPPDITELEIAEVVQALQSGWITTGPRVKQLEKEIALYLHAERAVCLNSATAALELTLRVLGIGEGDEVIVPAYTYTASASPVLHVGATVRFIDAAPHSFHLDYDALEAAISEKTKAVIPVDIGGVLCDYERIYEIVERKKHLFRAKNEIQALYGRVIVVSDCAHGLGAERNGKRAGELADFTTFSFHAVKNLTTAEGGAAVWRAKAGLDSDALYREYQLLSLHGQSKDALAKTKAGAWEYDIVYPAYKCNMTDIAAAMGLVQLKRYDAMLARRHEIIRRYNEAFSDLGIRTLAHADESSRSSGHLYLTHIPDISDERRRSFIDYMAEKGVSTNVHYKPLPMMTAYKNLGFDINDYPRAYASYQGEITLPLHTSLTDEEVAYVIKIFRDCLTTV